MDWTTLINTVLGNLLEIIGGCLAIVSIAVMKNYVVPWLQEKRLFGIVKSLMAAAETEFKTRETGRLKKEWVFAQLDKMGIEYDYAMIEKLIDGFTRELTAQGIINNEFEIEMGEEQ